MPKLVFPSLPSFTLPQWDKRFDFCGFNFDGFSIKLRILISFLQVLFQLGGVYAIPWPPMFSITLSWIGFINLDLFTVMPFGCFMPLNFYASVFFQTLILPIWGVLVMCVGVFGSRGKWLRSKGLDIGFWILFVIYPTVSTKVFAIFGCVDVDDGTRWLRADLSISCQDGTYTFMTLYSILGIIVYPIGTPAVYYYLLKKNKAVIDLIKTNQEARANLVSEAIGERRHEAAERRLVTRRGPKQAKKDLPPIQSKSSEAFKVRTMPCPRYRMCHPDSPSLGATWQVSKAEFERLPPSTQARLAALYEEEAKERDSLPRSIKKLTRGYEMRVWWFEIFECFRKLAIACVPIFFAAGSAEQLIFGLFVCFISFGLYVSIDPYEDLGNDTLAQACQAQIFFSLLSSIALTFDANSGNGSVAAMDLLLFVLWLLPFCIGIFLMSPVKMAVTKLCWKRKEMDVTSSTGKATVHPQ